MRLDKVLEETREIALGVAAPLADRTDREARWPSEALRALQGAGLGGLVLPRSLGGSELGLTGVARVCEVLGQACSSTALAFGMHLVASAVIAAKATAAQTESILVPIIKGEHLTTLALSEPGTGSRFYLPETRLEAAGDDVLVVTGEKSFVTNGSHADSYVVSTATEGGDSRGGHFSCILVRETTEGIDWGTVWNGVGMRGNSSRNLLMRSARIPRSDLLGEQGDQIWYVFNVVAPYFLMAMAGTYVGVAAAALEEVVTHVRRRAFSHTGSSLSDSTLVQHRVGELWARVARSRALVQEAARLGESGSAEALPALCSAKAEVADCVVDVVNDALTLVGGRGYATGSRLERLLRDARAAHVMSPTTEMLRTWTGRAVLDLPLLVE